MILPARYAGAAGAGLRTARRDGDRPGGRPPACCPTKRTCRRRGLLNAGERIALLVGQGAPGARRTRSSRWPTGSAPGSPPACSASRTWTNRCRSLTGTMGIWAPPRARADGWLRHAADRRHQRPVDRVLPRARAGASRADRHRRPRIGSRYPHRGRRWSATRAETLRRCCRCSRRPRATWRRQCEASVTGWHALAAARAALRRTGSTPRRLVWELPTTCRPMLRSAWTSARSSTGTPGTSASRRGARPPFRDAGQDGLRAAVWHRGEARAPGPAAGRADRRRGDADGRDRRADHRLAAVAGLGGSALRRLRPQQR